MFVTRGLRASNEQASVRASHRCPWALGHPAPGSAIACTNHGRDAGARRRDQLFSGQPLKVTANQRARDLAMHAGIGHAARASLAETWLQPLVKDQK